MSYAGLVFIEADEWDLIVHHSINATVQSVDVVQWWTINDRGAGLTF